MEHELKRQKMLVDANTTPQQEKLKINVNREVANLLLTWRPWREERPHSSSFTKGRESERGMHSSSYGSLLPRRSRNEFTWNMS